MSEPSAVAPVRFRNRIVEFRNGARGRNLEVPSASPRNYHQAITTPDAMQRVTLDGKLFIPPAEKWGAPGPLVIVVPGSLGIADDGAFVHPLADAPDPALVDRDLRVYALKAGYGRVGARIDSAPGEAELFRDDMVAFWRRVLA